MKLISEVKKKTNIQFIHWGGYEVVGGQWQLHGVSARARVWRCANDPLALLLIY